MISDGKLSGTCIDNSKGGTKWMVGNIYKSSATWHAKEEVPLIVRQGASICDSIHRSVYGKREESAYDENSYAL